MELRLEQVLHRAGVARLLRTTGGLTLLPPEQKTEILRAAGAAIDALGGSFTVESVTLVATALRR
jgi:hypothetical protein